ncbi:tRNA (32-2'-O)-methyltransferase regulator THADA-like [Babylonia areolata]|uniref:tRNA (32-2'-O)-methyltransferase regulator THADA-like n=1 Tax=Babylonia areolata TaxID=304850 RepID=UPI003FD121D6
MTSSGSPDASCTYFLKDPTLLNDVTHLRSTDVVPLTRRLEAAAKSLAQISVTLNPSQTQVRDFISQLICCFIVASENTRISRGLEKILGATGPSCQELVRSTLGAQLQHVLRQLSAHGKDLKKVSALLEHSRLVQEEISQYVPTLLEQLGDSYKGLLGGSPLAFNREDSEKLYYTVKVCLQLFQQFSALREQGWICFKNLISKDTNDSDIAAVSKDSDSVAQGTVPDLLVQIVNGVLAVLVKKNYGREVTLLAATAVSMVISAASVPEDSAQGFFTLHSVLTDNAHLLRLSNLHLHTATTDDTQHQHLNRTAEIAVLRSVLLGSTQNVLCCEIDNLSNSDSQCSVTRSAQSQTFLLSLFPNVCNLCDSGTEFQYLSFQLLSLWTQKLSSCLPLLASQGKHVSLMGKDSVILSETLKRVWLNFDSPVDGVAEFVGETLKTLLEVWHAEVKNGRSDHTRMAEELMMKSVQVPWYARSRYRPLGLLIPYINTDKLLTEKESLKQELLECMGASFLAALASDVYTAFLLSIRDKCREEDQAERWQNTWLSTMMAGLTNSDSLIRNKVCAYWLTSTLKILPSTGSLIQRHLVGKLQAEGDHSVHSQLLFAWVAVCRNVRTLAELDLSTLPELLLTEALYSDEEDICSEALFLLSTTQKKAEPIGEVEIRLLQACLPHCLKVDSAPFRQKLVTSLRKVFVRVRDSCSTAIKRKIQATFVDDCVRFMDWLYRLVMNNVVPGACFQRRRTCLDIVQAWFETVIFVEADGSKKGKAQGPTDVLIKYAESKGLWDFFSPDNRTSLLYCVVDGADEIQESAIHILSKYFPWTPSTGSCLTGPDSLDLMNHLLQHGLSLCDSPRAYENHSGALLIRLVYEKFVREQGSEKLEKSEACMSFFSDVLLHKIKSSLKAAEVDVLLASKSSPTHGLLQALSECLQSEQSSCRRLDLEDWQKVLSQTVMLSSSTVTLVLNILANGQTGNCPSFAQMGMALEQLVTDGAAEQEVTSSLSPEFQLLLSWCWLNLKESCTCLGLVTALGVGCGSGGGCALTAQVVEQIGETFLRVLTHCRHRGAIEGCRSGLLQFCVSLMLCSDSTLSAVPANILNTLLSSLEKDEMTSSVTRRSAGLPIIVQTIAQAEKRCKSSSLLHQTVGRLYAVASRPPSAHSDQTQDQAPVHALNVLRAVFSDASLSGQLLTHLGKVTELVIRSFESSSWALRNAATQLVSTLVTRMFGQRNKASLSCNMMTLQEWSAHFPELLAFVRHKLEESLQGEDDVITAVQPSLFLVLTLLASLGPATTSSQAHSLTASLRSTVMSAVSSPVYNLRELSASAVVALTPLDATESCVRELLAQIDPGLPCRGSISNTVHGTLMCLEKLLASRKVSHSTAGDIVTHILSNPGLVSATEQCLLLSAKCVSVLSKAAPVIPPDSSLRHGLVETLMGVVFSAPSGGLQLGRTLLISSATSLIVSVLESSPHCTDMTVHLFAARCVVSPDVDVRSAALDCLCHSPSVLKESEGKSLQKKLWHQLQEETDPSCVIRISRLLVAHHLDNPASADDLDIPLCPSDLDVLRSRFSKLANVQAALFPVEAVVLCQAMGGAKDTDTRERLSPTLCAWSVRLVEFSQSCQNEDFRMAAAQALALAGHSGFSFCASSSSGQAVDTLIASLVESCMVLLEETDSDIRRVVTCFVGQLEWKQKDPKVSQMNTNLCSKMFLSYMCNELGHCQTVRKLLLSKLYTPGELHACLQKVSQARTHYLFEPEENTFFSEKIHQQLDIYNALSKMHSQILDPSLLPDLLQELRTATPVLRSCAENQQTYNVCGEPRVLASLTGLVMWILLASGPPSTCGDSRHRSEQLPHPSDDVSSLLTSLVQIPNMHPALAAFLQPV